MIIDAAKIRTFKYAVWEYYQREKRDFIWRNTADPYDILISEVMLQQTQTSRVEIKFPIFLKHFPDFRALADASLARVLEVWQGMGYNRRAAYLKKLAEIVVREYHGVLPRDLKTLVTLPGIGKATAGAVAAFAFNRATPFIETNIRRVYIHFFFSRKSRVRDEEILRRIEKTLDQKNPREWYYALMDYGAMLGGLQKNPNHRSAAYKKQTPFKGSPREIRGTIIKELVGGKILQMDLLEVLFPEQKANIPAIIEGLKKENFIKEERGILSLV